MYSEFGDRFVIVIIVSSVILLISSGVPVILYCMISPPSSIGISQSNTHDSYVIGLEVWSRGIGAVMNR